MATVTIQQAFELAFQHHQAGHLPQAEALYRQILAQSPNHAQALHQLGLIARQTGRHEAALDLMRKAIFLSPNYPEAQYNLGVVLNDLGQLDAAIAAYRQAIVFKPNYPEAYNNLGNVLRKTGRLDEATLAFRQAIACNPKLAKAFYNLGNVFQEQKRLEAAAAAYRRAIVLKSDYAEAHNNLGIVLNALGQLEPAIASFRTAIQLNPSYFEAFSNLANALKDSDQLDEAIASCRTAIELKPDFAKVHNNLGNVLNDKGQTEQAIASYRTALELEPDFPETHKNLGLMLLKQGDLAQGWREFEWRWKCEEFLSTHRNFTQSQWDGGDLTGRTILLHAEQGLGDAIQFVRYLPLVAQRGGNVIVECQSELKSLLQSYAQGCQVFARKEQLPVFDVHCPLLSLPLVFETTLENIPAKVPYLQADAEMAAKWRDRLAEDSQSLKVGLAWAGNKDHKNDRRRSIALSVLAPLARLQDVSFYSLQKGEAARQAKNPPEGMKLTDWTEELKDFTDTAALIANLDLVICVDTAVAHLAGAMGKRVWVLLPFVADWRWLLKREDSPWYPTMRLYRQTRSDDWHDVIERASGDLAELVSRKG